MNLMFFKKLLKRHRNNNGKNGPSDYDSKRRKLKKVRLSDNNLANNLANNPANSPANSAVAPLSSTSFPSSSSSSSAPPAAALARPRPVSPETPP